MEPWNPKVQKSRRIVETVFSLLWPVKPIGNALGSIDGYEYKYLVERIEQAVLEELEAT